MVEAIQIPYRKLAGHSLSWSGPSSLWMADDHLLYISGYYTEVYRRFYFNDIEALVIQRTNARLAQTLILTLTGILFLLPFFFMPAQGRLLGIIPALFFVLGMVINQLRGPGCTCRLVTRVNDQYLSCLDREPLVLKAVAAFTPAVEGAQGKLTGDEVALRRSPPDRPAGGQRSESGVFHVGSCVLLLGMAIAAGVCLVYHHAAVAGFVLLLFILLLLCVLLSLLRQARSDLPPLVKRWTWAVFIFLMANAMAGYGFFIAASIKNAGTYTSEYEVLRMALRATPQDSPMLLGIYILTLVGALLLGMAGAAVLASYYSFRTTDRKRPSSPDAETSLETEA